MKNNEFDNIEIPNNIDLFIKEGLNSAIEDKKKKHIKRPLKVAVIVASISTLTITTAFGIDGVIKYFNNNKHSKYNYEKSVFETFGQEINLTSESNGIEFTVDNIAIDDNYINILYTIKSNKNIRKLGTLDEELDIIHVPIPKIISNDKKINLSENDVYIINDSYEDIQKEGKFINDNEMQCVVKYDVSKFKIENGENITIKLDDIFKTRGKWEVKTKIDKTLTEKETYNYDINKNANIKLNYYGIDNGENIDIEHSIDIQKVILSPFANKIVIKEAANKKVDFYVPSIRDKFILFDDSNKPLELITGSSNLPNEEMKSVTNTYEILGMKKDNKSLKLVPIQYDYSTYHEELEPKSIDNLPIVFEISKDGKLIIEDIKIEEERVIVTYYKEEIGKKQPITFHDENGVDLNLGGYSSTSMNRYTGRYTQIRDLKGCEEELPKLKKIKKISTSKDLDFELLYDQQIKINLNK